MRRTLLSLAVSGFMALVFFVGLQNAFGIPGAATTNVALATHTGLGYAVPTCTGFLHFGPYLNIVATGECVLAPGSPVNGKVTVEPGGSFIAENSIINGKLRSNNAGINSTGFSIKLTNVTITGDVKIKKSTGPVEFIAGTTFLKKLHVDRGLSTVTIDGGSTGKDLKVTRNVDPVVIKNLNVVGRNLDASRNGAVEITNNVIVRNLKCKKNAEDVTGGGNTAVKQQGQCKNL